MENKIGQVNKVEKSNWLELALLLTRYLNPKTVFKLFTIRTKNASEPPSPRVRTG